MKNKNILFICPSYPAIGGVETVTALLADFFIENGFQVFILVSGFKSLPVDPMVKHHTRMTVMPKPINTPENLDFIDEFIYLNDIACIFNQGCFSLSYLHAGLHKNTLFINTLHSCPFWESIIFGNSSLPELLRTQSKLNLKLKVTARYILNFIKPGLSHPSIKTYYRRQNESSSFYVVLDPAYVKELENKLYKGARQKNILSIPNPLSLPEKQFFEKKKQVLFVGRLTHEPKRVDRLLRIWKLVQEGNQEWELLILGDGEERVKLERKACHLKLKNIRFLGYQYLNTFYESASILCLTSTYEGFPMVIAEAQSYGVIPIAFGCVNAIYNLIDHEIDGLIIEPFRESAYANSLQELMQNDLLRAAMSTNALKKVAALKLENIGRRWLDLLEK